MFRSGPRDVFATMVLMVRGSMTSRYALALGIEPGEGFGGESVNFLAIHSFPSRFGHPWAHRIRN